MIEEVAKAPAISTPLARSAARNGLVGLLVLIGLASGLDAALGLGDSLLAKAICAYGAAVLVLVWLLPLHQPRSRLGPANQVTLARAVLTALLAALVGEAGVPTVAWTALALALTAELLDGLDGHLARRWGWVSPFGARFDMEIDTLLLAVLAVLVWSMDKAGPWVLAAGLLRYLFVAAGHLWRPLQRPLPPSRRRQAICVIQVLSLTLALAPVVTPPWSGLLAAAGLTLLGWSFAVDYTWLARLARSGNEPQRPQGPRQDN